MGEIRYTFKRAITTPMGSSNEITPSINAENVKDKNSFIRSDDGCLTMAEGNKVLFDYLVPEYVDDLMKVSFLCDFHHWIVEEPDEIFSYPISKQMKIVLDQFNLYPNKFYTAKVLFEEKFYDYFVWQLFLDGFDKYVDFDNSTFCEWKYFEKIGNEVIMAKNEEELSDISFDKNWRHFGFEKAVMKPEFKNNDCFVMPYPHGILISKRLKNALEAAKPALTGFEITPFPVEFEYF
ncbi:hypothetical protein D1816_04825 [Aquimarina sp. AD10]|uniref:hypothetical protein n=1 Tax=Aquimarina sp. AD10 TaxID=1714849 RepID=UPI000E552A35|nr:hypothetical protein [Aquimarina sp. AD10]AXT59706.1 hypothetical protein D1816_04825 [Aquimarina sp. AD10]RKM97582.1 hypothetical protein D7033_14405 [Aquimarina sp. AD10]